MAATGLSSLPRDSSTPRPKVNDASPGGTKGPTGVGDGLPARSNSTENSDTSSIWRDTLSRGEEPKEPAEIPQTSPPQIIVEPVSPPSPKQRRVDLRIRVSEEGISDLRLYQNGVAVQGDLRRNGKDPGNERGAGEWPKPDLRPGGTARQHRWSIESARPRL